ncbi:MAG: DUF2723 domain-containing protein [Muribaculaceae bacterium]|nr:DUF2723 domain-containing protein [Muribaculaceae bacterium]
MDKVKTVDRCVSWGVFGLLLLSYWLTCAPTVSYWDCPEYVSAAWRLEVGHPPGNPTWMLVERVITMLAPSGQYAARLVNLSSGFFTAFAGFFLAKILFAAVGWIIGGLPKCRYPVLIRAVAALTGALCFGWCDSVWYSAIEAEVYAFSIFMTALCVYVMVKWAFSSDYVMSVRYLVLLAYLFGLSLGIHQLNLLCIPALAIIWSIKRKVRVWWKVGLIFLLSLAVVGCILTGIMPSTITIASELELFCVNTLHLPFLSGVVLYLLLLGAALLIGIIGTARSSNPGVLSACVFPAVFLSGMFIFSRHIAVGGAVSAIVSILLVRGYHFSARRLNICMWMLALLLTGYASYALIPVRGSVPSPANSTLPGDPFSFASYQGREQYGGAPLLYGHTPLSKPIAREEFDPATGKPIYSRVLLEKEHPVISRKENGARVRDPYGMLTAEDSAINTAAMSHSDDAYIIRSHIVHPVLTPELNMWLPRITSRDPADLVSFADWTGMTYDNMTEVTVSEAVDSTGNFVNYLKDDGKRATRKSRRPTYAQSMRMLFTYQIGYMYFRYLLWNFSGRQNDVHSTGEVEHGNFITGFISIDNAMLGAEHALPRALGSDNKGRNRYFLLPFLFGLAGLVSSLFMGKRGRKVCLANFMLFVMTGLAIVVYLNQSPGEPRERDYSFLGSYWAFALWIGLGAFALMRSSGKFAPVAAILPLFTAAWMGIENFDDHDRSNRYVASHIARNVLNSLEPDAIIFVDGDNSTFPLWYAQEVEGVRKDVRVINLAYLSMPQYVGSIMKDWDGSKGVDLTLRRGELIYGALSFPKLADTLTETPVSPAMMLRSLGDSEEPVITYKYVTLPTVGGDTIIFPIENLVKTPGGKRVDFRKLLMFDIISTNAASPSPRPVYWHHSLPARHHLGLDTLLNRDLFTWRFSKKSADRLERDYDILLDSFRAPNPGSEALYLDDAPLTQICMHRAGLLSAAREMLEKGKTKTALRLAVAADSLLGSHPRSYRPVRLKNNLFRSAEEMPAILFALADSLDKSDDPNLRRRSHAVKLRAIQLQRDDSLRNEEWNLYYRTLPPALRLKIAK